MASAPRPGGGYARFADVASSFEQVQKDFANRPLFDNNVAREVETMSKRRPQPQSQPSPQRDWSVPSHNLHGVGGTNQVDLYGAHEGNFGPTTQAGFGTYVMPPPLQRPPVVHEVLTGQYQRFIGGEPLGGATPVGVGPPPVPPPYLHGNNQPEHEQATQPDFVETPQAGRKRRTRQRHHEVVETEEAAALMGGTIVGVRSENARKGADGLGSASNGDDEDLEEGMERPRREGPDLRFKPGLNKDLENTEDLMGIFSSPEKTEERWQHNTSEFRVESQIERAAMRCKMQQDRLKKQGVESTVAAGIVDGGVQTDLNITMAEQTENTAAGETVVGMKSTQRDTAGKTPPVGGLMLNAPEDYKPAIPDASQVGKWNIKSAPTAAGGGGEFPTTGAVVTAATVGGGPHFDAQQGQGQDHPGMPINKPGVDAIKRATQGASWPLMQRLDQLQLSNEELLIKNKAIDGDTHEGRDTIRRVAEGNRKPPEEASQIPLPLGGYGSVTEPKTTGDHFSPSKWQGAKIRNELEHLEELQGKGNTAAELRKFASELPTESANTGSRPRSAMRLDGASQYNARKKWSNVSFSTPLERQQGKDTVNPIEELSSQAKLLLSPVEIR